MATTKVKKTAKQKWGIFLKVILGIVIVIAIFAAVIAAMNIASVKSSNKLIASISAIEYKNQLKPEIDETDGYYTFTTDNDLKVVQLSDIHIGAGFMSTKKDAMAINAVEAMVSAEKPDLVQPRPRHTLRCKNHSTDTCFCKKGCENTTLPARCS